jgi:potassium-transporting ATPase KdpC subunit
MQKVAELRRATPLPQPAPPPGPALREHFLPAVRVTIVTLVLTGLAYPLVVTGIARVLFPHRAGGSLAVDDRGKVVGSELLAQGFASPAYFQPRPSAAGEKGYDPLASGGSNLGPTSRKLRERAAADVERLRRENPEAPGPVPVELVTTSGSGLDPHLSPAATRWQVPRIARARQVSPERIRAVVEETAEGRDLGLLGEPRSNVLLLNLALDRRLGAPATPATGPAAAGSGK